CDGITTGLSMADNSTSRSYGFDAIRRGEGASQPGRERTGRDPLAELARLIGQDDQFNQQGDSSSRAGELREPPAIGSPSCPSAAESGRADWRKLAAAMHPYEDSVEQEEPF